MRDEKEFICFDTSERRREGQCRNRQTATTSSFSTTLFVMKKPLPVFKCSNTSFLCFCVGVCGPGCIWWHCRTNNVCTCLSVSGGCCCSVIDGDSLQIYQSQKKVVLRASPLI